MSRRFVTINQAAAYLQCSNRTVGNYIGRGLFPAYKVAKRRSHYVDLNEVDAALARTPRTIARPAGTKTFGPNATIIEMRTAPAVRPEVVTKGSGQ